MPFWLTPALRLGPALSRIAAALGLAALGAGTGCSTVDEGHVVSSRTCHFQVQGYRAEVREVTREGDAEPGLYLALTALDPAQTPYAIDGFRQGAVFRISLQDSRRYRHSLSTVWGTAASPVWRAPTLRLTEGRALTAAEEARAGALLEQASTLAFTAGRWQALHERPPAPLALKLP